MDARRVRGMAVLVLVVLGSLLLLVGSLLFSGHDAPVLAGASQVPGSANLAQKGSGADTAAVSDHGFDTGSAPAPPRPEQEAPRDANARERPDTGRGMPTRADPAAQGPVDRETDPPPRRASPPVGGTNEPLAPAARNEEPGAPPRDAPGPVPPAPESPETSAATEGPPPAPLGAPSPGIAAPSPAPVDPAALGARTGPSAQSATAESVSAAVPSDTTMYLTVPRLGIRDAPVLDTDSDAAMEFGAIHLPQTGYPWEPGANTYVSGHRIGFPGTPSDRLFHDLPLLEPGDEVTIADAQGNSYSYAVSETHEVGPRDTWVTNPVPGRDVLSLQTCIEDFGDLWSEGPDWSARYVVQADRVS